MNKKQLVHNTFNIVAYMTMVLMVFPVYEIALVVIESAPNGFIFIDNVELSNRFFFSGVMPFLALTYTFLTASFITLKTN